jgi:hypothetical protein
MTSGSGPSSAASQGGKGVIPINDIYHLIDRLERLMNESWQVPLSTYLVVNVDDCLDVIDQMRTAIPQEVRRGERIQQERERIIAQAEEEAERIVQLAREDAIKLAEEHEVILAAKQRAQTIVERAQREADTLKGEADEYAKGVLLALDDQLGVLDGQIDALLNTVRNGLTTLSGASEPAPGDES